MATGTTNPPGSDHPLDLRANAKNLDFLLLGPNSSYPDRLGAPKRSWDGINAAYDAAEADRDSLFHAQLANMGYELPSFPYAAGIELVRETQLIERMGEFYKAKAGVVPFTTTGVWATDELNLVAVGDAVLRQELAAPSGASMIGNIAPFPGAVAITVAEDLDRFVIAKKAGAIGDGGNHPLSERYASVAAAQAAYPGVPITSLSQSIDWAALQACLNYRKTVPGSILLEDKVYVITDPLVWKGGAFLKGVPGRCSIKLAPDSNCSILVSENFDSWASWTTGMSNVDYTLDGGIDGVIMDGNAEFQTVPPTSAADMQYGLRIHSHRFGIGWLQVRRMNGIGVLTQYNTALMFSFRVDGVDDYGLMGDPRGTPSPYDFKRINVIDCLYEHFVFRGPADIPIWHLTTNYCGWLDNSTIPTTPRTSLLFPDEEIHSVRIETAVKVGYVNANGAIYGRNLYVAPFARFHADTVIQAGGWGGVLISGSAIGAISSLSLQQNTWAWNGDYKPCLEIPFATGSAAGLCRFSIVQTYLRRLTTPVTTNAIGPGILDNAGAQFGIIDGIDSSPVAGHALVIGATNRGGIYESVNFQSLQGTAADGTASTAVVIESGARDWRISQLRITNCDRGILNLATNMRGIVRDGTIETTGSQIAMEGIVAESQVPAVIPGSVGASIALDNISSWGLELLHDAVRYYNRFKTTVTFNGATAGAQASASTPHTMWRTPQPRDMKTSTQFGGTTWPDINVGIRSITSSAFVVGAFVHTPNAGTVTVPVEFS